MAARAFRVWFCAALLGASFASAASAVRAESGSTDSDRASALFLKGRTAYNDGKYEEALRLYSEAWLLKEAPDIAANLAQSELELGRYLSAATHFAFALAHLLPSTTETQKQALASGLADAKKGIVTLHVTLEPSDAELRIDDAAIQLSAAGEVYLEPGDHHIVVTREGYQPNDQSLELRKSSERVLWLKLEPNAAEGAAAPAAVSAAKAEAPALVPAREPSVRPVWPVFVGSGLFAAGAVAGVAFLLEGNSRQDEAHRLGGKLAPNACSTQPAPEECGMLQTANSDLDRARRWEVASFAFAGAFALGTAAYVLWPTGSRSAVGSLRPRLALARSAAMLAVEGRL